MALMGGGSEAAALLTDRCVHLHIEVHDSLSGDVRDVPDVRQR